MNIRWSRIAAVGALLTVAAVMIWAHEGHAPLPTRGASVDVDKGVLFLSRESREALDVQTTNVEDQSLPEVVTAYATLASPWQRHGFASSRLPGRIARIHAQAGQRVAVGQILADIESLELETFQLELLNAQNEAKLAGELLAMLKESAGAVPSQQVLDAESRLRQATNALDMGRIKWRGLGLPPETLDALLHGGKPVLLTLPVRSPVAGTIIHADLIAGKVIEPSEHLFEIVDLTLVWARIGLLESDLGRVVEGMPVTLRLAAYPSETFSSTVRVKGLALDPQTGMNAVWAEFRNPPDHPPRLLPGMNGHVQLQRPAVPGTKTVPVDALVRDGVENYVLVESARTEKGSEYRKTPVIIHRHSGTLAVVKSGSLLPGTAVVTRGAHELAGFFEPHALRFSDEAATTAGLVVEPMQRQIVEEVVELDGIVEVPPGQRSYASSHLSGNLERIHAEVGQQVRAGQLLAEVFSIELQNLQLDLLREQLNLQLLDQQFADLNRPGSSVPQRRLLEIEAERIAVRNRFNALRRRLEVIGLDSATIEAVLTRREVVAVVPVRAAASGRIVHFEKALGQSIKAEEPLFELHDLSRTPVRGFVAEREYVHVAPGQSARVRFAANPKVTVGGKVVRSGRTFEESHSLSVWIELEQSPSEPLRHNQLAQITLTRELLSPVPALPLGAVVRDGTSAFVFVLKNNGTFERRNVLTGRRDDRWIEILGGVNEGEMIAVAGAEELATAHAAVR